MLAFPHFQGKNPAESMISWEPTTPKNTNCCFQVHSAFRWGKSVAEIEEIMKDWGGPGMKDALAATDAQNGNKALHIAAQNGHLGEILR